MFKYKKSFTLIELILMIFIIILFFTLGVFYFGKWLIRSRDAIKKVDLMSIQGALDGYRMASGTYPDPENAILFYDTGGVALWQQGIIGSGFKFLLNLPKIPKDQSGNYYEYSLANNRKSYQLKAINEQTIRQKVGDEIFLDSPSTTIVSSYNGFLLSNTGTKYILWSVPGLFSTSGTKISVGNINVLQDGLALNNAGIVSNYDVSGYFGQDASKYKDVLSGMIYAFPDKITNIQQASTILKNVASKDMSTNVFNLGTTSQCGTSDGQVMSSIPTQNLCITGNASAVNSDATKGIYSWVCGGLSGGVDSSCKAYYNTIIGDDIVGRKRGNLNYPTQCKGYKNASAPYSYAGNIGTGNYRMNLSSGSNMSGQLVWCDMDANGPYMRPYDITGASQTISKTVLLLESTGSNGYNVFTDNSFANTSLVNIGTPIYSTSQIKLGTTSLLFDGNSGIKANNPTNFNFGTGAFDIDFWVNLKDASRSEILMMYGSWNDQSNASFYIGHMGKYLSLGISKDGQNRTLSEDNVINWSPSSNTWYHIVLQRNTQNMIKVYIDGKKMNNWYYTDTIWAPSVGNYLMIGYDNYGHISNFSGFMDEIRVIKGAYIWDDDFTPPNTKYRVKE